MNQKSKKKKENKQLNKFVEPYICIPKHTHIYMYIHPMDIIRHKIVFNDDRKF